MTSDRSPFAGPRVGVLINNYNNGPWLRTAVDSVLAQTRPADEIIVYDDGSTDDSIAILRGYGDRIRLIEGIHDNHSTGFTNQAAAVFNAFVASTADHCYLLDGDDVFLPEKIRAYEDAWRLRPEAVMVQAPMMRIDADGRPLVEEREARKHCADHYAATYSRNDTELYYWTSALAFSRQFLATRLPVELVPEAHLAVDSILAGIAPLYGPVVTLDSVFTEWRRLPHSMSHRARTTRLENLRARITFFNHVAAERGARPLRIWLNREFYKECLRATGLAFLKRKIRFLTDRGQPPRK